MKIRDIRGIGKGLEEKLNNYGIYTSLDLLFCFPKKYYSYIINNKNITSGSYVTVSGFVVNKCFSLLTKNGLSTVIFYLMIDNVTYKFLAFNQEFLKYKIKKNDWLTIYGKYDVLRNGFIVSTVFFQDFYERVDVDYNFKDIKNFNITSALKNYFQIATTVEACESLPDAILKQYRLYSIGEYLFKTHLPRNEEDIRQVIRRRKYEELFWFSFSLNYLALISKIKNKKIKNISNDFILNFNNLLPFDLTSGQIKVLNEIMKDTSDSTVMNRLVEGDVSCGKTIVSIGASLMNLKDGYQVCVMTPTEILANQTLIEYRKYLPSYNIEILTRNTPKKKRIEIFDKIYNKQIDVLIGTHALLNNQLKFINLGLIIIDEQHKFGVSQRALLIDQYPSCDKLYLTATPIPRTLGLTNFADLSLSVIDVMPNNRKKISTKIVDEDELDRLCILLNKHLSNNEQIYIVCPVATAEGRLFNLNEAYTFFISRLNGKIGVTYGKQNFVEKNNTMDSFSKHEIDVLISTTVIEVGINVISSTVMVILNAERFGLSTLHQLRGRVGRGSSESFCFLVTKSIYNERLKILEENNSGFDIAEYDLKLRGPGDYFGNDQSGYVNLEYADFSKDIVIWQYAKKDGIEYSQKYYNREWKNNKADEVIAKINLQSSKIN